MASPNVKAVAESNAWWLLHSVVRETQVSIFDQKSAKARSMVKIFLTLPG
jgi:hypothetical protein